LRLSRLVEDLEDVKSLLPGYGWLPGPGDIEA
jgi:hypothetical protein